jgi:CBS domain-containing protein
MSALMTPAEAATNLAFFLTAKSEVLWILESSTMRSAIDRMARAGLTAVPVLDEEGRYVGTVTEGDLLWKVLQSDLSYNDTVCLPISEVPRQRALRAFDVNARLEELLSLAEDQNFVPVVDDRRVFIGIVRRRTILAHLVTRLRVVEGLANWGREQVRKK